MATRPRRCCSSSTSPCTSMRGPRRRQGQRSAGRDEGPSRRRGVAADEVGTFGPLRQGFRRLKLTAWERAAPLAGAAWRFQSCSRCPIESAGGTMRRVSRPFVAVAVLLAALMPLEQAHCAFMGLGQHAVGSTNADCPGHTCCAPKAASERSPAKAPADRDCVQSPPGAIPSGIVSTVVPAATFATIPSAPTTVPAASVDAPASALDVGSPPLPIDPGAHGLRAPPLSA
jgi:hypothetical protein